MVRIIRHLTKCIFQSCNRCWSMRIRACPAGECHSTSSCSVSLFDWRLQEVCSGVFQSAPYLPLQLVMNVRTPGPPRPGPDPGPCVFHRVNSSGFHNSDELPSDPFLQTLEALDLALQPFLQAGWLTTVDTTNPGAQPKQSALTIIITGGNTPPSIVLNPLSPFRYMFYDAPLKQLDDGPTYNPALSPMASATFSSLVGSTWVVPSLAKKRILRYVKMAHDKGIAVRVTEPIDFPTWIRCVLAPVRSLNV